MVSTLIGSLVPFYLARPQLLPTHLLWPLTSPPISYLPMTYVQHLTYSLDLYLFPSLSLFSKLSSITSFVIVSYFNFLQLVHHNEHNFSFTIAIVILPWIRTLFWEKKPLCFSLLLVAPSFILFSFFLLVEIQWNFFLLFFLQVGAS